jgi:thymidylate synthase
MAGRFISDDSIDDILRAVYRELKDHGRPIFPGKGEAIETVGTLIELKNPACRISLTESRGKLFSGLGEFCWYMSGSGDPDFISYYVQEYPGAGADGPVPGAYGPRLFGWKGRDQVAQAVEMLRTKRDSRRVVIQLFAAEDLMSGSAEIPCTCFLQFFLRDNRLTLMSMMRSNDVHRGLPHDVFCFTMLQELVARQIGVEMGTYIHCVGSLHFYQNDALELDKYLAEGYQEAVCMPPMPAAQPLQSINEVLRIESRLRTGDRTADIDLGGLLPYWADLARLLVAFRMYKNGDRNGMERIARELNWPMYQPYVLGKAATL